jgi:hypothetical protein
MLVSAAIARAQQVPSEPIFHAGTKLVQVSVIAQVMQSKPVANLQREPEL